MRFFVHENFMRESWAVHPAKGLNLSTPMSCAGLAEKHVPA